MPSTDSQRIEFASLNSRTVTSDFEGGQITSDGGVTLLAEVDRIRQIWRRPFIEFADDNAFVNKQYWKQQNTPPN